MAIFRLLAARTRATAVVLGALALLAMAAGVLWPRPEPASANPLTGIAAVSAGGGHVGRWGVRTTFLMFLLAVIALTAGLLPGSGGIASAAHGGQHISSSFVDTPPNIDGSVGFGEWQISNRIPFDHGFITFLNDSIRLYILVDVLDDTIRDDTAPQDVFRLTFDVDRDGEITPDVDLNYREDSTTGNMRYQFYQGPASLNGLQPDTWSSMGRGFGCFAGDGTRTRNFPFDVSCSKHRVWEFGIDLAEIGAQAGDTVRMGLRVFSPNPSFSSSVPTGFTVDFTNLIEVALAAQSAARRQAPDRAASISLEADPIELTQGIQNRANFGLLVADKDTVARVYADVSGVQADQPAIVSLYGSRLNSGVDLPGSPLSLLHSAPSSIDREQLNDTANFLLPATWDDAEVVEFRAVVRDLSGNEDSSIPFSRAFFGKETPTYWVIPINTNIGLGVPRLPNDTFISRQESYTETVFPVPDINFVRKPWQAIGPTTVKDLIADLKDYRASVSLVWARVATGERHPFVFPDQIYGFTRFGSGMTDATWNGGNGHVARGIGSDKPPINLTALMSHEINHNLDRSKDGTWGKHVANPSCTHTFSDPDPGAVPAGCKIHDHTGIDGTPSLHDNNWGCGAPGVDYPDWPRTDDEIGEVGFDTRLPWVDGTGTRYTVIPSNFPDLASYCQSRDEPGNPNDQLPTKWISIYRLANMFFSFGAASSADAANAQISGLEQQIQPVYYLSGQVNEDGTGSLDPVLVQPGIPELPIREGGYSIEVQDGSGTPLLTVPFFASFIDVEGEPVETVPFTFELPAQRATAAIVLKLGDQVLDTIDVSPNPPVVTVVEPNGLEQWDGLQTIRWTASDPDQDPLSFTILYTPDGGSTFWPVAWKVSGNSYEVDTTVLPGGEAARIVVIATDGFNTVEDDSDGPFTVARKPPQVTNLQPAPGAQIELRPGELTRFRGEATDLEDEFIIDDNMIWSFDDTFFGTGREVDAALPGGDHVVTLTVVDSDGNTASRSIEIRVTLPPVPTPTPAEGPPLGGGGVLPLVPGAGGSSGGAYGIVAGVLAAVTAGALALGGAAWYARRRLRQYRRY